jgi:hypothetical protein
LARVVSITVQRCAAKSGHHFKPAAELPSCVPAVLSS